ncbi:hypothetical protein LTR78_008707 [Recurvomyces mirabilis]|uniref:DUF155 domain-containing protein n=1 Tax=Recurvomyces mirabilis TaxID=574656 RepID=A0AAE0WIW7_9PEZI|nr:hypothetical protein LTR78_008707 [Recurvomyces mirabilis]KAK5159208.1 hypothetical protein LTS14_002350 [Recurvomyces mirabilis]
MTPTAATLIAFRSIVRSSLLATPSHPARRLLQGGGLHVKPASRRAISASAVRHQDDKPAKPAKRKAARTETSTSLKRVLIEAQRSRAVLGHGKRAHVNPNLETKDVTAFCAAETYNISVASDVFKQQGFNRDPLQTGLYPQVLHVQTENIVERDSTTGARSERGVGDVFVFPSGTVVAWNVPEALVYKMVEQWLPKAAENGHLDKLEVEDMEYLEDPSRDSSKIVGDTIILGTNASGSMADVKTSNSMAAEDDPAHQRHETDTVLAKIAFSSALARSTKLAVLENLLSNYFTTTRSIPTTLSAGSRLRFSRAFILKKTGELLSIRAQLNLYSELTDSLPDLFWDSPHELGLENYYEQVGRALDVGIRIKVLNERMDYASEIAAVLRERLSEKHSTELEWLIIFLISVEVAFEIMRLWRESKEKNDPETTEALLHEYLQKQLTKQ